jgi:hypothetical protein
MRDGREVERHFLMIKVGKEKRRAKEGVQAPYLTAAG